MSAQQWQVVPHVRRARGGRERRRYTVERGSQIVLAGFSDEPQIYRRRIEAQQMADLLNAGQGATP